MYTHPRAFGKGEVRIQHTRKTVNRRILQLLDLTSSSTLLSRRWIPALNIFKCALLVLLLRCLVEQRQNPRAKQKILFPRNQHDNLLSKSRKPRKILELPRVSQNKGNRKPRRRRGSSRRILRQPSSWLQLSTYSRLLQGIHRGRRSLSTGILGAEENLHGWGILAFS